MATLENYRKIVRQLLQEYADISASDENIRNETLFDLASDRYLLLSRNVESITSKLSYNNREYC